MLFGAGLGLFSAGCPTGGAPGLPLPRGGLDPWGGGFNPISCRVLAPSSLRVTSQIPGTTTPLKSSLLWAGEPARSREEPPRTKWAREGKEVGAAAPPCKKFRETPRTPPPSPFRVIAHAISRPTPRPPPITTACAGLSPNSPLDVPLNKTIGSKTRKPRLVLEPPISPFATWIPILQECEAAKPELSFPASPQPQSGLRSCADCLARPSADRPRPRFPSSNH